MRGWRARIGLIIPAANINMEPEFYAMVPKGVTVHASRMLLQQLDAAGLIAMTDSAVRAARELKTAGVDLLLFGCTSGSFIKGIEHDRQIAESLVAETSIPTLTTSTAILEAMRLCGIQRVGVASPYTEEINGKLREFLEQNGIVVSKLLGLGLWKREKVFPISDQEVTSIGIQEPAVTYRLVRKLQSDDVDGYFISCTNLRSIEVIEPLERDLDKPVISSNQASLAIALRHLGIRSEVRGFGSLFER